jgi:phage terminase large subunit
MKQKTINLHEKQYQAYNFTTQYCAAIAGVQSGKTFLGAYWTNKQINEMPLGGIGMIVAPTYKILDQSTLVKFFGEFPQYRQFYKEQKRTIILGDKTIFIRSAEEPYSLEGITADWVWGDEAGKFSLLVWTILRSRTAIKQGKILFTTTPYNMGWLYRDFFIPARDKKDPDLSVITWASIDSPYFSKEFFNKEKGRLRAEEFNRRYLGEFTRMEGLVYQLHQWHVVKPFEGLRSDITLGGIDWGWTNPAALIVIKYFDGKWYVVDEWYKTGKTTKEIAESAISLQNKWGVNRWYADSANPEKIVEAGTGTGLYIIPYDKGKNALQAGISYIQQEINEGRFFIFDTCKNTLNEFETYHYPEMDSAQQPKMDTPVPEDNHLMDCARYAIHGYQPARKFAINVPIIPTRADSVKRLLTARQYQEMGSDSYK